MPVATLRLWREITLYEVDRLHLKLSTLIVRHPAAKAASEQTGNQATSATPAAHEESRGIPRDDVCPTFFVIC